MAPSAEYKLSVDVGDRQTDRLRSSSIKAPFPLCGAQFLQAAADASGNVYRRPTMAIACSMLDAGQADVMTDRHDGPLADFEDTELLPLSEN